MLMIRRIDLIGLAGFATAVVAILLLFPGSPEHMNWKYLLGGLALWFAGVASVVGWLFLRWSVRRPIEKQPPASLLSATQSQPTLFAAERQRNSLKKSA
jgi:hypothetical protein